MEAQFLDLENVSVNLFYDKNIEMDTELAYNLTTDYLVFLNLALNFLRMQVVQVFKLNFQEDILRAYDDTPQETELTIANVAISITKSPEAKEPFDINKYLPLFIRNTCCTFGNCILFILDTKTQI